MVHVYTQGNGCTGSVKGESMYLFGEQRQTCLILVIQNTFSILAKKIEGAWVMKWTEKVQVWENKGDQTSNQSRFSRHISRTHPPNQKQTAITTDYMMR